MARFLQQLRLLLWKNCLSVYRQPLWSLTLLIWPLVIFIILAITRSQFPPVLKSTCYVAPRNLASAGFFPFLQTLLCSTDSNCSDQSHQDKAFVRSLPQSLESNTDYRFPFIPVFDNDTIEFLKKEIIFQPESTSHPQATDVWDRMLNTTIQWATNITSTANITGFGQEILNTTVGPVSMLKETLCSFTLPFLNMSVPSSQDPLTFGFVTFCQSNNAVLEVTLLTLNQMVGRNGTWMLNIIGKAVEVYSTIQQDDSLWKVLLGLPTIFLPSSPEKHMGTVTEMLFNIQRTVSFILSNFMLETNSSSVVNTTLENAVLILHHIHSRFAAGSLSNGTGTVGNASMITGIDPFLVHKLLEDVGVKVSSADVAIVTQLLNGVVSSFSSNGSSSVNYSSLSWKEQLFLNIASQVLELLESLPSRQYTDMILMVGHACLEAVSQALATTKEQTGFLLKEAVSLQQTWFNISMTPGWLHTVAASSSGSCADRMAAWSWVDSHLWKLLLCPNDTSALASALQAQWMPVVGKVNKLMAVLQGSENITISAPMLLSDWKALLSAYQGLSANVKELSNTLNRDYWSAWIPGSHTVDWGDILTNRYMSGIEMAWSFLEKNPEWPKVEPFFQIAHWIVSYQANTTSQPHCTVDPATMAPLCQSNFTWEEMDSLIRTLIHDLTTNSTAYLRYVQGSVAFLNATYGDFAISKLHQLVKLMETLPAGVLGHSIQEGLQLLEQNIQVFSTILNVENFNIQLSLSVLGDTLEVLGLRPLEAIWSQKSINASTAISFVLQNVLSDSTLITNGSSQTLMELVNFLMQSLRTKEQLAVALSYSMADALLNYTTFVNPTDLLYLKDVFRPTHMKQVVFEQALDAIRILKKATNTADDRSAAILGCLKQLKNFMYSQAFFQTSTSDLPALWENLQLSSFFLLSEQDNITTFEDALEQLGSFLPEEFFDHYTELIYQTTLIVKELNICRNNNQDCASAVFQTFILLDHMVQILQNTTVNLTLPFNISGQSNKNMNILSHLIFLANNTNSSLSSISIEKTLSFLYEVSNTQDITLYSVQDSINKCNLTLAELRAVTELVGSSTQLLSDIIGMSNVQQCAQNGSLSQAFTLSDCVIELLNKTLRYVEDAPLPQNMKKTFNTMRHLLQILTSQNYTACYVKSNLTYFLYDLMASLDILQKNVHDLGLLSFEEVNTEFQLLKAMVQTLGIARECANTINSTSLHQPGRIAGIYMNIVQWYLTQMENMTSNSSFSEILNPLYTMTKMHLAAVISQSQFTSFVVTQTENLVQSLHFPLSEKDVSKIGHFLVNVLQAEMQLIKSDEELQKGFLLINLTGAFEAQVEKILNNTHEFLANSQLMSAAAITLQWNKDSFNFTRDIYQLVSIVSPVLADYQQDILVKIAQVSHALSNIVFLTSQEGEVASVNVTAAISETIQSVLNSSWTLPDIVVHDTFSILDGLLWLIFHPNASQEERWNLTLNSLTKIEVLVEILLPNQTSAVMLQVIDLIRSYMGTISHPAIEEIWEQLELEVLQLMENFFGAIPNWTVPSLEAMRQITSEGQSLKEFLGGLMAKVIGAIKSCLDIFRMISQSQPVNGQDVFNTASFPAVVSEILKNLNLTLPDTVVQDALGILNESIQCIQDPNMSYMEARNLTLHILEIDRHLVEALSNSEVSDVLLQMSDFIVTYLMNIPQFDDQDIWNQIVNELHLSRSTNNSYDIFVNNIKNISELLTNQGGNMSLEDILINTSKVSELAKHMWNSNDVLPTWLDKEVKRRIIQDVTVSVLEMLQMIHGHGDNKTWEESGKILQVLESILNGTPAWDIGQSALQDLMTVNEAIIQRIRLETDLLSSIQEPLVTLVSDVTFSVNSSHVQILLHAFEAIQQAAEANAVFSCNNFVKTLVVVTDENKTESSLNLWCNNSLLPALNSSIFGGFAYGHTNTTGLKEDSVTPLRVMAQLHSLYLAVLNQSQVVGDMTARLSPFITSEGPTTWSKSQLYQSYVLFLDIINTMLEQTQAPMWQPYLLPLQMTYILQNPRHLQNITSTALLLFNKIIINRMNWTIHFISDKLNESAEQAPRLQSYFLPLEMFFNYILQDPKDLQNIAGVQHLFLKTLQDLIASVNRTNESIYSIPLLSLKMLFNLTIQDLFPPQNNNVATPELLIRIIEVFITRLNLSTDSIFEILEEIAKQEKWMQQYVLPLKTMLNYNLQNSQLLQNVTRAPQLFFEVLQDLIECLNRTNKSMNNVELLPLETIFNHTLQNLLQFQNRTETSEPLLNVIQVFITRLNWTTDSVSDVLLETAKLIHWMQPHLPPLQMMLNFILHNSVQPQNLTFVSQLLEPLLVIINTTHWNNDSVYDILDKNANIEPWLKPFVLPLTMILNHTLQNPQLLQNYLATTQFLQKFLIDFMGSLVRTTQSMCHVELLPLETIFNHTLQNLLLLQNYFISSMNGSNEMLQKHVALNDTLQNLMLLQNTTATTEILINIIQVFVTRQNWTIDSMSDVIFDLAKLTPGLQPYLPQLDGILNLTLQKPLLSQNITAVLQFLKTSQVIISRTNWNNISIYNIPDENAKQAQQIQLFLLSLKIISGLNLQNSTTTTQHILKLLHLFTLNRTNVSIFNIFYTTAKQTPWIQSYLLQIEYILNHTLQKPLLLLNTTASPQLLAYVLTMLKARLNWTSSNMYDILNETTQQAPHPYIKTLDMIMKIVEDQPVLYKIMVQLMSIKDMKIILDRTVKFIDLYSSTSASGEAFLVKLLPEVYDLVKALISAIQTNASSLFLDIFAKIFGNVISTLEDNALGNNAFYFLPPSYASNSGLIHFSEKDLSEIFMNLAHIDYSSLLQIISVPPSPAETMETVHVLFSNPNISIVLKALWSHIGGGFGQNETIDTVLSLLSYVTTSGQWEKYIKMFSMTTSETWNKHDIEITDKLIECLGGFIDLAITWSQQDSLGIAVDVADIVKTLSSSVSAIVEDPQNSVIIQFLTALSNVLKKNVKENISSKISAVVRSLVAARFNQTQQSEFLPKGSMLESSVAEFAPLLSTHQIKYLNMSIHMMEGFVQLLYCNRDIEKMTHSLKMISDSLENLLTSANITLPDGRPVQEVCHPLILNSGLVTYVLWNLTSSNQTQQMVLQVIDPLVSHLPSDQQKYALSLQQEVSSALAALSFTEDIPVQVTNSILTKLNVTEPQESPSGLTSALSSVSHLLSTTLWRSFMSNRSSVCAYQVYQIVHHVVSYLTPVLTPDGAQYMNSSLSLLQAVFLTVNNSDNFTDLESTVSVVISSVKTLLANMSNTDSKTPVNILIRLQNTLQMVMSNNSNEGSSVMTAGTIAHYYLLAIQHFLSSDNSSVDAHLAQLVLESIQMNADGLLAMNVTNWPDILSAILYNTTNQIPDDVPYSLLWKNITMSLLAETPEIWNLILQIGQTIQQFITAKRSISNSTVSFEQLSEKVCLLEDMSSIQKLYQATGLGPSLACKASVSLVMLFKTLASSQASFSHMLFEAIIGNPETYQLSNWVPALSSYLGFNVSSLTSLNLTTGSPGPANVSTLFRNSTMFILNIQQVTSMDPTVLHLLMDVQLPQNSMQILVWFTNLQYCSHPSILQLNQNEELIFGAFCSLSLTEWYNFVVVTAEYVSIDNIIYRLMMSSDLQKAIDILMHMMKWLVELMEKLVPILNHLQVYLTSVGDLKLTANAEFRSLVSGQQDTISSRATFATLSQSMCSQGIMSLFDSPAISSISSSNPSTQGNLNVEELIKKFNIPLDATPFCRDFYLDMVNTTAGAIAWAFIKPMLQGKVLYTPDTPLTRTIMQLSNTTLQQFGDLKNYSQQWLDSFSSLSQYVTLLERSLPMLQNSLSNTFIQNFIVLQTGINSTLMKDTLDSFSNITALLSKNQNIIQQVTALSSLMVNLSSCISFDRFRGFNSTDDLNVQAKLLDQRRDHFASIVFELPQSNSSSARRKRDTAGKTLPAKVAYTIRMNIENVMRTDRIRNPFWTKGPYVSAVTYQLYNRGFVYLQENIERAIIELQTGTKVEDTAVQLQAFPYPCYLKDDYLNSMSFAFPLVLMIAWVLFVANSVKRLVHERELRLHEYMKMMGVNPISHFFAWFLEGATFLLVTIIILTIILKAGHILPYSNGFLLFLYLCDYGLAILAISFLISTFFDKTNIAGLSGSLIYVICFFPFIVVVSLESSLSFSAKSALGLFAPTCFSYASQYISRFENQGEGIQWDNSYSSPMADDTASFGWFCWLLLIDSVIYFLIGAYIRIVFPGKYGIAAPWYFPVMPSFWADLCGNRGSSRAQGFLLSNIAQRSTVGPLKGKSQVSTGFSSQEDDKFSDLPIGVELHGLTKMYRDRAAIQNLNISFYESHVTALLGHNGAGKTTTMSLLTGLFSPSSGTITVYGKDMRTSINEIRRQLGVCMQYDVHFDHLTAKEHLLLYGKLKAPQWTREELLEEVRKILQDTGLYTHRHKRVGTLSGGMKRKLSISMAFIGDSRVVVLDEPTTGVDPCSRRSIWDIIIRHKHERTIILSTHHLDEAEVLSDRIAFLERGGLKCCGSPFYLKEKLGQGYNLTLTKKPSDSSRNFDQEQVSTFVRSYISEARLKEGAVGDLVFALPPLNSHNAEVYHQLLSSLDGNRDALGLGSFGISDITLEEVFLQLNKEDNHSQVFCPQPVDLSGSTETLPEESSASSCDSSDSHGLTGSPSVRGLALFGQRVGAVLMKRMNHSRRDWKGLIAQVLLPVLFVIAANGLGSIKSDLQDFPSLQLTPALYLSGQQYAFFSSDSAGAEQLVDTMMSFPGADDLCLDDPNNPVCFYGSDQWTSSGNFSSLLSSCQCSSTGQVCSSLNYQPPNKKIPSSQILYNLTGIDTESYLLTTANGFIRNRYGGWSFGQALPQDLQKDLTAVPSNRTLTKVWYNPEGYHSMPAYLNSLSNFILRSNLPVDKDPLQYEISVFNYPYPGKIQNDDIMVRTLVSLLVTLCILTGYSIMMGSFVIYEVQEHHTGSKCLQHISGIGEPFYWTVNFLYDMVLYMVPVALSIAMIAAFQLPAFTKEQNLCAVSLLLILFGFASFPWMYLLSGVFKDTEMAFISYVCINLLISINTIISTSVIYYLWQLGRASPATYSLFQTLSYVFLVFPQFSFGNGLMELARADMQEQLLSSFDVDTYTNPFAMDMLGWTFVALTLQGVVFFTLRLIINRSLIRRFRKLLWQRRPLVDLPAYNKDEDVAEEEQRVASGGADADLLQVRCLTKVYQHLRSKVQVVKGLSVGIPAGECFGLLGVNGAGKTTTFRMLTGDISPTDGSAQIRDWDGRMIDTVDCRNEGLRIGYCPQVDALDDLLTGEEHLYFYARIRGVSSRDVHQEVSNLLKKLELSVHRKETSGGYSCGMRRKLSTAIALIGHPQILLLDEPSSGMDPHAKRHLWRIISEVVKEKCAVVLTSHSMEECEALCTRLAIMVKGQFRCLGSLQHIKSRFGRGYTVKMYMAVSSCEVDSITRFMQLHFPGTCLKDWHWTTLEYHVPLAPGGVAHIFHQLESNKPTLQIKHFSVSQTTLDEVFINFALGKVGAEDVDSDGSDLDSLEYTRGVST